MNLCFTSSDMRWTSVTSHQAHAHPPTMVVLVLAPQQPPVIIIQFNSKLSRVKILKNIKRNDQQLKKNHPATFQKLANAN